MHSCPICEKHRKHTKDDYILYEDKNWVISHGPIESQILGYIYLEPKNHYENWSEFTDSELSEIGKIIKKVEEALRAELPLERLYSVTISEAVRHIHFHLIPRLKENEVKGLPLIEQATQGKKNGDTEFLTAKIQKFIQTSYDFLNKI